MSDAADQAATEASDRVLAKWGDDYRQGDLREKIEDGLSWSPYPRVKEIRDEVIDVVLPVLAEALAERDLALWLHAEARQACDYVNAGYDALQTAYADAGQQLEAVEAERDRLSTLLRGMARRASWLRQGWDSAERVIKRVKAELAETESGGEAR